MNTKLKQARRIQIKSLVNILNEWIETHENFEISDRVLQEFLEISKNIKLSKGDKFAVFVGILESKIHWSELCKVFEYWLRVEPESTNAGTYAVWHTLALSSLENEDLPVAERRLAADTAIALLERDEPPSESAEGAFAYGQILYHHPDRVENTEKYCISALEWLDLARKLASADEDSSYQLKWIDELRADCYFELQKWQDAMNIYETLASTSEDCGCEELKNKIKKCKNIIKQKY